MKSTLARHRLSDSDRLRWAVAFADEEHRRRRANIPGGERSAQPEKPVAVRDLQAGLAAFLGLTTRGLRSVLRRDGRRKPEPPAAGFQASGGSKPSPWTMTMAAMVRLQQDAYELLLGAAKGDGGHGVTVSDGEPISLDVVGRRVRVTGSTRAAFLFTLASLLAASEAGADLRACPQCGRVFVRKGRQLYCGRTCTTRATWQNATEEQKRKWRKSWYEAGNWTYGKRKGASK